MWVDGISTLDIYLPVPCKKNNIAPMGGKYEFNDLKNANKEPTLAKSPAGVSRYVHTYK